MSKVLLKQKQKLSPRANGQTLLIIPQNLQKYFNITEKSMVEYTQDGKKIIIKIDEA